MPSKRGQKKISVKTTKSNIQKPSFKKPQSKSSKSKSFSEEKKILKKTSPNILNKKQKRNIPQSESSDDSSDEEVLVRTGDVPEKWYDGMEHVGYDINSQKVMKKNEEDEVEKFIKKANDKNWWREIYDSKNNSSVYLSDKDLEIINRIRQGKFANKSVGEDDYFEDDLPYQIHPMSNQIPSKKKFGFSRNEQKTINRLVYLYKNGLMPMEKPKISNELKLFDIWEFQDENDLSKYRPGFGYQIPKRDLPDNEESYNTKENKEGGILRRIPRYDNLIEEELERCCDLFLSARTIRKKLDLKENDILPDLPKPEELKPFPTKECIIYKGHESSIRDICCDPNGNVLISADNGNLVFFWDIHTGKIITKFDLKEKVRKININKFLKLIVICTETHIFFILPKYLERKYKEEILSLVKEKIYPKIKENIIPKEELKDKEKNNNNNITINDSFIWHIPKSGSKKEKQGILFYMKWTQGLIKDLVWHNKGDYFGTLSKNSQGKSQVYIHSLTKMTHQLPISHIKGNANCISFHPNKPYFIVATNSNIFIYNLQKQELVRKFISNLNTINKISIHKNGNDLIAGDKSGKVAWFQIELSSKPFKLMDYHQDKIKSVEFNNNFPLFLSCSRNGKLVVYYGKVNDEELIDPLIVPLKVLKTNNKDNKNLFTCACFHPNQIWIFSGGEDGKIRMWC